MINKKKEYKNKEKIETTFKKFSILYKSYYKSILRK